MLNKISLRNKLLLSFAAVLTLFVIVTIVNIIVLLSISRIGEEAYADGLISVRLIGDATTEALSAHNRLRLYQTATSETEKIRQLEQLDIHLANINALLDEYETYHLHAGGGQLAIEDFKAEWTGYLRTVSDIIIASDNDTETAEQLFNGLANEQLFSAVDYLLLVQDIDDNVHRAGYLEGQEIVTRSLTISVIVTAVVVVLGIALQFWLANTTATPISEIAQAADEIAAGNLNQAIPPIHTSPELATLSNSLNAMTTQLRENIDTLESTVTNRTRALEASMEVSQQLATIIEPDELVAEVVTRVREAFDYYHVHIYLLDESKRTLLMAGGTGEVGTQMMQSGHKIEVGRGLVGRTAQFNEPVLVSNVATDPEWLPNPLLPDTKAETAVPISAGERLFGVLDVQHNVVNGLTASDVDLLMSIAQQIAISLQNAAFIRETQNRAQQEALINTITQRIQETTSVEQALQIAAREIGRALDAKETSIQLGTHHATNGSENPAENLN